MTDLPALSPDQPTGPQTFRPAMAAMAESIVSRVREKVPPYAGPVDGPRHQLMVMATNAAIRGYLAVPPTRDSERRKVDELYRRMGWGEAQEGHSYDNLDASFQVAVRCAWEHLADYAAARDYPAATLRNHANALFDYADHLRTQLLAGHTLGSRTAGADQDQARTRLVHLFRGSVAGRTSPLAPLGVDTAVLTELADRAQWPVPEEVVALAVSFHGDPPPLPEQPEVLAELVDGRLLALCPAGSAEALAASISRSGHDRRVALSWPVPPEESGSALLWVVRALDLVQLGTIAPTPLVRCTEHATHLWLHAEPSMRQRLCQELLRPLLAETPNSREILSETLLTWLESRDSAPAIAARLDVHPQTVRYRWRRINELFGEALRDPEFVVQVTLVLKASVPMWKAGSQGDFELFRDRREQTP